MVKMLGLFVGSLIVALMSIASSPSNAVGQSRHAFDLLQRSTHTGTVRSIRLALSAYQALSKEEKELFLDSCNADSVLKLSVSMQTQLLRSRPSEEVFLLNSQLMDIVQNCAECSESMDGYFAEYFVANLKVSLTALGSVRSDKLLNDVCERACFEEGNASKILGFIRSHKLTDKKYYEIFLRYE